MKIKILTLTLVLTVSLINAQIGINTTNPDPSSILDIASNNKGVLFPRVSLTGSSDTVSITNPVEGLFVYNTATVADVEPGFYFWDGSNWVNVQGSNTGMSSGVKVYAEIYLNSTQQVVLKRYNDIRNFPLGSIGAKTDNINIINTGSNLGFQPKISGLYKVSYSVTYDKVGNNGTDSIEFYLTKKTNEIANSAISGVLERDKRNSLSVTKLLNLHSNQTYYIGISKTSTAPNSGPTVNIYPNLTNIIIELIE